MNLWHRWVSEKHEPADPSSRAGPEETEMIGISKYVEWQLVRNRYDKSQCSDEFFLRPKRAVSPVPVS